MKILYAQQGFEQDNEPQVCLEGTSAEFEHLISIIGASLKNNNQGELLRAAFIESGEYKISFYNKDGDTTLMKMITDKSYLISLDHKYWEFVMKLLKPLSQASWLSIYRAS